MINFNWWWKLIIDIVLILTHPIDFRRDRLHRPLILSLCLQMMRNKDIRESYSYKRVKVQTVRIYGQPQTLKKMGERKENILQGCGFITGLRSYKTGLLLQIVFLLPSGDPALVHLPSQISSLTQVKNKGLICLQSALCHFDSLRNLTNPVLMQVMIVKTTLREYDGVSEDQKLLALLSRLMQTNSVFFLSGNDWFVSSN